MEGCKQILQGKSAGGGMQAVACAVEARLETFCILPTGTASLIFYFLGYILRRAWQKCGQQTIEASTKRLSVLPLLRMGTQWLRGAWSRM